MREVDRVKLLFGPYRAPKLKLGDRATCLYRDTTVTVTSFTDAPIPWPRCSVVGQKGGSGLLVNEELARAVRSESSLAIQFHWRVTMRTVGMLRKALAVTRWGTPGSKRLHQALSEKGAAAMREEGFLPTEEESRWRAEHGRRVIAKLRAEGRWTNGNPNYAPWTPGELELLGTDLTDEEIAAMVGRTPNAVRVKRRRVKVGRGEKG
jgi:hypothetical protein